MELSLVLLINVWNCIVVHFNLCLPQIDIVKLCKVANYKDASTSYEPFETPTTDDLILLDFDSISHEPENLKNSTVIGAGAEKRDRFCFTEFKSEHKHKKHLKLCDSLGSISTSKYPEHRNKPLQHADYSENLPNTYNFKEKTIEQLNAEIQCGPNTLVNGPVMRTNVEATVAKMKITTNKEERLSIEEISSDEWGQTLKHHSKTKSDNKKPISTQHTLNALAITPVKGFETKIPGTAAENNEMNSSVDLSIKEFLSLEKASLKDWQENQAGKQKSMGENVYHSQSNIPVVSCKSYASSCKLNPVRNSTIVNENNNRPSDFCNKKYKSAIMDETCISYENMLFTSDIDNINEIHIQPSQIQNSSNSGNEIKDTTLTQDSMAKEKISRDWYLESMGAKHKILDAAVMYNKVHNSVDRNLNFKAREAPESHFKQHDLSNYNRQSENKKLENDLNLRNKFESLMVGHIENEILKENEDRNVAKETDNILRCDSYLANRNSKYHCAFLAPLSPLTGKHEEKDLGETYLATTTTPIWQSEHIGETQPDDKLFCTDTLETSLNVQTESIQGTKKVQFNPEVQTFTYEKEHNMMENFVDPVDLKIENPIALNRRMSPLSRSFTIRNCYDSMHLEDNCREDWVNYDQRLINLIRDHPRIPEVISEDYMEDITDVTEKDLKFWSKLKIDRKIFRKKKGPYIARSEGEMASISRRLQSIKLDPKPLFNKLKKKMFGK